MRSEATIHRPGYHNWQTRARIIWAITLKDILEALKNKSILSLLFSALFIVVAYRLLPALSSGDETPRVFIYNSGSVTYLETLENSQALTVRTDFPSLEAMQRRLADWDVPALGLVLPPKSSSEGALVIEAYVLSWADEEDNAALVTQVEQEFSRAIGQPVTLEISGNKVYPWPESDGLGSWAGLSVVFAITMVGMTLIPHLMLEEKQNRTIDVLRVSPASSFDLTVAKALTGVFYALLVGIIVIAIYATLILQWWLVPLVLILGALFPIGIGLLLGTVLKDRSQMTLLGFLVILPLFLPVFLSLMIGLFPAWLNTVFKLVPTTVFFNLVRTTLAGSFSLGTVAWQLAYLAIWDIGLLILVALVVGRLDRQDRGRETTAVAESQRSVEPEIPYPPATTSVEQAQALEPLSRQRSRPALAIAWKDIQEALKNKLFISIVIGTAFLALSQAGLQAFVVQRLSQPSMVIYDPGASSITQQLAAMDDLSVGVVPDQGSMIDSLTTVRSMDIGVVLPQDFEQQVSRGGKVIVDGYLAHWYKPEQAAETIQQFEEALSQASGAPIEIRLAGYRAYPSIETGGTTLMSGLIMMTSILIIGLMLVPMLMIEEKEAHTLQVLLVSPATFLQVMLGKALAGGAYTLAAAAVVILLNQYLVAHWGIIVLAAVLSGALAIGLGLLVGSISNTTANINMWSSMIMLVIIATAFIQPFAASNLPESLVSILDWMPGAMMLKLFRLAMVDPLPLSEVWRNAAGLIGLSALVYGVVLWRLRQEGK